MPCLYVSQRAFFEIFTYHILCGLYVVQKVSISNWHCFEMLCIKTDKKYLSLICWCFLPCLYVKEAFFLKFFGLYIFRKSQKVRDIFWDAPYENRWEVIALMSGKKVNWVSTNDSLMILLFLYGSTATLHLVFFSFVCTSFYVE